MRYLQPKEELTEQEVEQGLKALIKDGIASQAMSTFTGGVILVALAVELNASNLVIGLLAAIPALLQLLQLPSIYLVEKVQNRRLIVVLSALLCRLPWLLIAIIPFIISKTAALGLVLGGVFVHSALASVANCAWNSWMRDFVPEKSMGTFFSKRMQITIGVGLILTLLAGGFIDWWKQSYPEEVLYGYSLLFILGFLAGMIGVYFISKIPEPKMNPITPHLLKTLAPPFKDANFRSLILFTLAWSFAVNLAAPFFTVYMLQSLELGMSLVVIFSVLSQLFSFYFLNVWGKCADRFSNKSVLAVSGPLFLFCILGWTFTTMPEKYFLTIPLLILIHILMGIATSGVAIASSNIGLKLAPRGEATSYLAVNTIISSIGAGIAPILGGKFADFFASCNLSLTLNWKSPIKDFKLETLNFSHWDFFFVLAFILGIYALRRLSFIKETGEMEEQFVRQELLDSINRPLRSLSSVAGLFQLISYPLVIVKSIRKKNNNKNI